MLNTVGRCIYTKYRGILYVEHYGKIYLKKKPGDYFMLNTMGRFIYTKYWGLLYVEHCGKIIYTTYLVILYFEQCGKIYLHKILKNTLC